ncbi:hypothetical protein [Leptolyngbya sp. CCY15150]|uniref:ligand-binding sensor domain-containing protein n=1 Tax=Leptolyngbya sp. CCY15150 TaxID=2767772 RepID=UPI001950A465|nr:hypothetical protein [Leptolyngbya sp. CCY15150]
MSSQNYTNDLPVLLRTDDLPIPAPDAAPQHELAAPSYPDWLNLASQCHIRNLSLDSSTGDLWLATGGGILHWHSGMERFTRYSSEHGLPGNSIKLVAVDGNSQPWVAHENSGLSYLDGETWQPYLTLSDAHVSCFTLDQTGHLWVGADTGLYKLTHPTKEPTLVELPLHSTPPRSLAITTSNDIWLCTAQGVFHRQEDWQRYNTSPRILTLTRQANNLWLGTLDGLVRIDLLTDKLHPVKVCRAEVSALAPIENGVWAACGKTVGLATETDWTPVNGKAWDWVTSLIPASGEGIWIGTHSGLQFASSTTNRSQLTDAPPDVIGVRSPHQPPIMFSNLIQDLTIQKTSNTTLLWIGTARGVFRVDLSTETWRRLGKLGNQDIRALAVSESGQNLWVSSFINGLYDAQQPSDLKLAPEVLGPITALECGVNASFWAGGLNGVYNYGGGTWQLTLPAKKLPNAAWIRAIAQAKPDCVWLGTSVGLLSFNPETQIASLVPGSLGGVHIQSLLALSNEEKSLIWVGTQRGLYLGQGDDWQPVTTLGNRSITALAADLMSEKVWVGTNRGLWCLHNLQGNWEILEEFTVDSSGLAHNRITALTLDTSCTGEKRLWVGTPCGLSVYTYESG